MKVLLISAAYFSLFVGVVFVKKIPYFNKQFFRFCIVGVCNTLNYFVIYTLLHFEVDYVIAHIIAFIVSALISYVLTTKYTFKQKCNWETFIRFPLTFLPNLFLSTVGTVLLVKSKLVDEDFASLVMMIGAIPITFIVSKLLYTKGRSNE